MGKEEIGIKEQNLSSNIQIVDKLEKKRDRKKKKTKLDDIKNITKLSAEEIKEENDSQLAEEDHNIIVPAQLTNEYEEDFESEG